MEVRFFDTFTMVSLWIGQTEESLLEEGTNILSALGSAEQGGMVSTHSFSFQKAKATFWIPWVSQTPAIPSSPHLYARERACSWVKSCGSGPC